MYSKSNESHHNSLLFAFQFLTNDPAKRNESQRETYRFATKIFS